MEPKTMKKPSQNQCRNLMRKRESIPVGPEHSPGPGGNYKSTRLPVGNLHKNKINKIEGTLPEKKNEGGQHFGAKKR